MNKNQVNELLTTLAASAKDSTRKSVSDTVIAMAEIQVKTKEKLRNDPDLKLPEIVVDVMEELRIKLMEIWAQNPTASSPSKKTVDGFIDALITRGEALGTEQEELTFMDNLTAVTVLSQTLIDPLTKEAVKSTQNSFFDTGVAVAELHDKMKKSSSSHDGKSEMEELRGKLLDTWAHDTGESIASKEAVDAFVNTLIKQSNKSPNMG